MIRRRAAGKKGGPGGPFLKWAGGKGQLLKHFEPLFPGKFSTYHEPFLGAGAVFFALRARGFSGPAVLADSNADLILTFESVRDRLPGLIRELRTLKAEHSPEAFYAARERFNGGLTGVARAAHVIYLNKAGFNGLYRVNSRGEFNVPIGRYIEPDILNEPVLALASERLARTTLAVADFEKVKKRAKRGDFVYFDPPYDPLTRTANFTSYSASGFGRREQERLAETFRALDSAGVQVMLSNHDTPLMRELYEGFDYRVVARVSRVINSRAERRSTTVAEVVVRNYET